MPSVDTLPLIQPLPGAPPGRYELRQPLGLRGLAALARQPLDAAAELHAEVTVLHLLECQGEVERDFLGRATGPRLTIALLGPLSFSAEELARLAPEVTTAQVEAAVKLLLGWSRRWPERVQADLEKSLVGLTPWTTPLDLRRHLDGLHRHELAFDPLAPLSLSARAGLMDRARRDGLVLSSPDEHGLGFRFADDVVQSIVASVLSESDRGSSQARLRLALDQAAGVPRGAKKQHLRVIPAPRYDEKRPARTAQVELVRAPGVEKRPPRQRAAEAITAVRRVAREGAKELVLGGSGAAEEWYLGDLVALARSLGFERVVLETDATTFADPAQARSLATAGLSAAEVALLSFDPSIADGIRGVPGSLARTLAGTRVLLDAGVAVTLAVPLVPENRGELARIVEQASSRLPASTARIERVVARPVFTPRRGAASLSAADAARELTAGAHAAALAGLAFAIAPGSAPPPCTFAALDEALPLLHLSEGLATAGEASGNHARIALCDGCGARHVCPGPLRALAADVQAHGGRVPPGAPGIPATRERERVLRELVSVLFKTGPDGKVDEHHVLRINFHCNQACDFCFVSRELPPPEDALLQAELLSVAQRGASLALSGGEPTLNPRLPEYLARARELGIQSVQLQTNAIKMSDPAYTAELVAAGLANAFVSLHGTSAAVCDRVTAAPGTFVKTLAGVANLLRAGVAVCLNFVLCAYNAAELADLPDFAARELLSIPGARCELNFSFVAAGSENVPRDTGLIPRFSDVAWALEVALRRARELGIPLLGFDSQCGVPACFLPAETRAQWFTEDLADAEMDAFSGAFRKAPACAECALTRRCYGLRAAYADTYGVGELRPLARE